MKLPILGQAYLTRSPILANNRMVNLYPEQAQSDAKEAAALLRCPGLASYGTGPSASEVRGMISGSNGTGYAVVGSAVCTVTSGTITSIGTIGTSSGPVSIRDNGVELIIVDGLGGYLVNLTTNAVTTITDADFPNGCTSVAYVDTYFITGVPGTDEYVISGNSDGSMWDALDFSSAEGNPDILRCLTELNREIRFFGVKTGEAAYNSGNADFPFTRVPGANMEHGICGEYAFCQIDNTIFWIGDDGIVYRMNGYSGKRVSHHGIEYILSTFDTLSDIRAFAYAQEGHSFACFFSPSEGKTLVYDVATNGWHERAGFSNGEFVRWRANCYMFHESKHLVGDYANGKIYELSLDTFTDDGQVQKCLRSFRSPNAENRWIFYPDLIIDCEMGVGLDGDTQGDDPMLMLRWSDDGGRTWSSERTESIGRIGQYANRTVFRRCGKARDRVWEISISDPVRFAIVGAYTTGGPARG